MNITQDILQSKSMLACHNFFHMVDTSASIDQSLFY